LDQLTPFSSTEPLRTLHGNFAFQRLLYKHLSSRRRSLARLELLHLRLPIKLGIVPQDLPRLLNANETLARVRRVGLVRYIGETELDQVRRGLDVRRIRIGDVEDVRTRQARFDCEPESLRAVSGVDVAEAAAVSMGPELIADVRCLKLGRAGPRRVAMSTVQSLLELRLVLPVLRIHGPHSSISAKR
jgi:hypothetical protein